MIPQDAGDKERLFKRLRAGYNSTGVDGMETTGPPSASQQEETETTTSPYTGGQAGFPTDPGGQAVRPFVPPSLRGSTDAFGQSGTRTSHSWVSASRLGEGEGYDEGMHVFKDTLRTTSTAPQQIVSLYNAGQSHISKGQYEEAKRLLEDAHVLLSVTTVSVSDLPGQLNVCVNHCIGYCHYELSSLDASMNYFRIALLHAQAIGLSEFEQAAISNCIGMVQFHKDSSNGADSLAVLQSSLSTYEKYLCRTSPDLATLHNNIGRVHYSLGNYEEALEMYEKALATRRMQLGSQSLDVAATVCNIGQAHHQLGELDKAMECYREFLHIANEIDLAGEKHGDIAKVAKCIGEIYHERKELERAKDVFEQVLKLSCEKHGGFHPETASLLTKLGALHFEMNNHNRALNCYAECLRMEQILFGTGSSQILATLMRLAQIHRHLGNYNAALVHYEEVYFHAVAKYGISSIETANAVSNMGMVHYQLQNFDVAFALYQKTLAIQRHHYGSDDNADVASSLNSIGLTLFSQGALDMALDCFHDSLCIREKVLSAGHRDIAIMYYNIATVHLETGDEDLAIKNYETTLQVERTASEPRNQDLILTLQHLALVHQQRGELEKALEYFGEALEIERAIDVTERRLAVAKLLNLMGNIYLQIGKVEEMMTCYADASRIFPDSDEDLLLAGYNLYGLSKLHPPCAPSA